MQACRVHYRLGDLVTSEVGQIKPEGDKVSRNEVRIKKNLTIYEKGIHITLKG